jgi:hypothetical protein
VSYGPEALESYDSAAFLLIGRPNWTCLMQRTTRRAERQDRIPMYTRVGDVLILLTAKSYTVFAVGSVLKDGQCGFEGQPNVQYMMRP